MARSDGKNFIFTALGAAMGLGNAMRFPGLCVRFGGAFIIAYAVALVAVYPLLYAELSLGKRLRSPFPAAIKSVNPRSGAVGWAACVNSAFIAVFYSSVIARLAQNSLTFGVGVSYERAADMPDLTPILCALCWLALGFLLTRTVRARARVARFAVIAQSALFALLAARGLVYENSSSSLSVLAVCAAELLNPEVWLNALGQALLSLSVAAGVMPSFAADMPDKVSPKKCALVVSAVNFTGGVIAAVALITVAAGCNLSDNITSDGFTNALSLFPKALATTFKQPVISGIFGTLFLISLTLTAAVSALSLLYPLLSALGIVIHSLRARAFLICGVGCAAAFTFVYIPQAVAYADFFACNVISLVIAAAEAYLFLSVILTGRLKCDKISVWKIYLK